MASVGNDTVKHAAHLVSYTTRSHTVFLFWAVAATGGRVRFFFAQGGEPLLRTRGMIGSSIVYGKAPMRQVHGNPIAVSGRGHTGKQINSFDAAIHMQESPRQAVLSRMQLTLHATRRTPRGALRLVLPMSARSENPTCSVPAL